MIKSFDVPSSNKLNEFHISAKNYMKFSNNVSSINVVSSLQDSQIDRSRLTRFTVGSNVKDIQPSCFISCENLTEVQFKNSVNSIGNYAFYGCSRLKKSNIFDSGQIASNIGDYAFSKCGIETLKFGAKNYTSNAYYIGVGLFAECNDLKSVSFSENTFLAQKMFSECHALTNVSFAKTTKCIEPGAFDGCSSLKALNMPSDTYAVPDEFAKDCTQLTSFSFSEPGNLSYDQALGDRILAGTSITSLTFPASVTSLNVFSNNTLNGLDQLKEIHFNGMQYNQLISNVSIQESSSDIQPDVQPDIDIKYDTHKIYYESSLDQLLNWAGIDKSIYVQKSTGEICNMMKYCYDNNIPMVAFDSGSDYDKKGVPLCGNCRVFALNIAKNTNFINFVQNNTKCILMYISDAADTYCKFGKYYYSFFDLVGFQSGSYVIFSGCYMQKNNKLRRFCYEKIQQGTDYTKIIQDKIIARINELTDGFNSSSNQNEQNQNNSTTTVVANAMMLQTNCFGLGHDVRIFSNDGKYFDFKSESGSGAIVYQQNVQVDHITIDYFKYGQWYSNAKLLKQYADANYIPVLVVLTQSSGYRNSMAFQNDVFNDKSFQEHVQSKNMLLCIVSTSSKDSSFVLSKWMQKPSFTSLPLMMMYWLKKDGSIIIPDIDSSSTAQAFDALFDDFAYFSINQADDQVDDVRCVHSANEIISWIDSLDAYGTYKPQAQFMKPAVSSYMTDYPRYQKYQNQIDDDYGRYFPVMAQKSASRSSYEISVNNANGTLAKYTLAYNTAQNALPPAATYQYFSMLSNDMSLEMYNSTYQVSGLMFKIGSTQQQMTIKDEHFNYAAKTETAYLAGIGVTTADMLNVQSSFMTELYVEDDEGDPTEQIDQEVASTMPFLYNVKKLITLKPGKKINSNDANEIVMLLSSQAQVQTVYEEDDEGDIYEFKTLVPGNPQYAIDCKVFGQTQSQTQLLWIKEFYNE